MRVLRKEAAGKYLLFCLALVPTLLFAYLGHFSRLMPDDYKYLGKPVEIGIWQALHYFRGTWHGGYTNFLLYGLLAPRAWKCHQFSPQPLSPFGLLAWHKRFGILGNQATSLLNRHRASFAHGCGRYQRIVFATIVLLVYGNCRIHLAASPAFDLLDNAVGLLRTRFRLAIAAIVAATPSRVSSLPAWPVCGNRTWKLGDSNRARNCWS